MCQHYMLTLRHFTKRSSRQNVRVFCVPSQIGQHSGTVLCAAQKSPLHAQFHQKVPLIVDHIRAELSCLAPTKTKALAGNGACARHPESTRSENTQLNFWPKRTCWGHIVRFEQKIKLAHKKERNCVTAVVHIGAIFMWLTEIVRVRVCHEDVLWGFADVALSKMDLENSRCKVLDESPAVMSYILT